MNYIRIIEDQLAASIDRHCLFLVRSKINYQSQDFEPWELCRLVPVGEVDDSDIFSSGRFTYIQGIPNRVPSGNGYEVAMSADKGFIGRCRWG